MQRLQDKKGGVGRGSKPRLDATRCHAGGAHHDGFALPAIGIRMERHGVEQGFGRDQIRRSDHGHELPQRDEGKTQVREKLPITRVDQKGARTAREGCVHVGRQTEWLLTASSTTHPRESDEHELTTWTIARALTSITAVQLITTKWIIGCLYYGQDNNY